MKVGYETPRLDDLAWFTVFPTAYEQALSCFFVHNFRSPGSLVDSEEDNVDAVSNPICRLH